MKNQTHHHTYGSFFLGETEFVINVNSIQEVVNLPSNITAMPLAPGYLVGIFNLRSLIIPVISLKKLLNLPDCPLSGEEKVAIIEHMGVRVGLIFDKTSEILRIDDQLLSDFNYGSESGNVIKGAIKLDNGSRIIQLLDPFSIINIENIPQVAEHQKKHHEQIAKNGYHHENRKKCISFQIDHLKMAFDISGIHEIVKVEEINQSTFLTELCLGIINLRGQVVPIINFRKLLEMNDETIVNIKDKRIVVLARGEELFGLLVDSVESISTYMSNDIIPIPLFQKNRSAMFLGCITLGIHDQSVEVLLLNHDHILNNEEVFAITHGHSKIYQSENETGRDANSFKKKFSKREAFISFKLNHLFGVSIGDIREIINYPQELMCPPGMPSFVLGMLNLRGEMVTIIETRILYDLKKDREISGDSKILIFISNEEKFGLVVDSVENIVNIDNDHKMKVPGLMTQQVSGQFGADIKEIVSIPLDENKDGALIILNMEPVTERIRRSMSA